MRGGKTYCPRGKQKHPLWNQESLFHLRYQRRNNKRLHAHKNLEQVLICVNGSCEILLDDGKEKSIIKLENRNEGLFIEKMVWHEMFNFSADCVLIVLASDYYDEKDYIRDYNEFKNYLKWTKLLSAKTLIFA